MQLSLKPAIDKPLRKNVVAYHSALNYSNSVQCYSIAGWVWAVVHAVSAVLQLANPSSYFEPHLILFSTLSSLQTYWLQESITLKVLETCIGLQESHFPSDTLFSLIFVSVQFCVRLFLGSRAIDFFPPACWYISRRTGKERGINKSTWSVLRMNWPPGVDKNYLQFRSLPVIMESHIG